MYTKTLRHTYHRTTHSPTHTTNFFACRSVRRLCLTSRMTTLTDGILPIKREETHGPKAILLFTPPHSISLSLSLSLSPAQNQTPYRTHVLFERRCTCDGCHAMATNDGCDGMTANDGCHGMTANDGCHGMTANDG
jgi:hypothetical protein